MSDERAEAMTPWTVEDDEVYQSLEHRRKAAGLGSMDITYEDWHRLLSTLDRERKRAASMEEALRAILAEPYGCPFCDSGTLRKHPQIMKDRFPGQVKDATEHRPDCGYELARRALGAS